MSAPEQHSVRIVEDQWATFRHIIEAVAIVAAGIWAFYTFVYQEKIKPAAEPAALDISIAVHRLGRDQHRDILGVSVHFHNSGKSEINIAADAYNVWGDRYATRESVVRTDLPTSHTYARAMPRVSRRIIESFVELREAAEGGKSGMNIILEPGASEELDDKIVITRGEYDLIHAQAIAVPVKTSQTRKVRVTVLHNAAGGNWIEPNDDGVEDDNDTDFALIP